MKLRFTRLANYGYIPVLPFPPPIRSRAGYGGNPGRKTLLWIFVPRLRGDKLYENDTKHGSPREYGTVAEWQNRRFCHAEIRVILCISGWFFLRCFPFCMRYGGGRLKIFRQMLISPLNGE